MNSLTVKILAALVSILMVTTLVSQSYYFIHDKHDTEEAVLTTINEDIPFQGVIIRDEKVITYDGDGVLDYQYSDGSKISINNTIANVYSSENAIIAKNKISLINKQISELKRAQNPGTTNYVEPETIKKKIDSEYKSLISESVNGDISGLQNSKEDLSLAMNVYNIVTNSEKNYNEKISELKDEKKKIKADSEKPKDKIKAEKTGYFVSYADGFEKKLTTKNASKLTDRWKSNSSG